MSMQERKRLKIQEKVKKKTLPKHVKEASSQLAKMEAVIRDLLGPFTERFHFFEAASSKKKKKNKK